jgi:hypothetical protein
MKKITHYKIFLIGLYAAYSRLRAIPTNVVRLWLLIKAKTSHHIRALWHRLCNRLLCYAILPMTPTEPVHCIIDDGSGQE